MRYAALAVDYDGTLATHGKVGPAELDALARLRATGRRILMVSGRELPDLRRTFDGFHVFDRLVLENGALLFDPHLGSERTLVEPPLPEFARALVARGIPRDRISIGRVIIATWEPFQQIVFDTIHEQHLALQVIFNKGAVMILPAGVNKATGLRAALAELAVSPLATVGIGDAENDHAFLRACGVGVAVANALPALKEQADLITRADHGAGVIEIVEQLLADGLEHVRPLRHSPAVDLLR